MLENMLKNISKNSVAEKISNKIIVCIKEKKNVKNRLVM